MKKTLFIFDPRSDKEQIKRQLMEILDIFTRAGYEFRVHMTQKQKDAVNVMVRLDEKVDVVVCSGGDGAPNETISRMMKLKKMPLLDYTPAGSTNDFATSSGIPRRISLAVRDVVGGIPFATDTEASCKDRNFIYIAASGAFTEAFHLISQDRKSPLGHQAYMLESVENLVGLKSYHMKMEWNGQVLEEDFAFGMVTNIISVGGSRGLVNQSVALSDGPFEILLIRMPRTPVNLSSIISYVFLREGPNEYVHKFKTSSIRLISEQEVDWALDGEYGGSRAEVTIGNIRENIQILLRSHPEEKSGRKQIE